jgi:formylglycine-generating enzyme required for sulfatase activity
VVIARVERTIAIASAFVAASAFGQASTPDAPDGMLLVPAGTFTMGSADEGELDERPAHRVSVGAYFLDRTEVTQAAYAECVTAHACAPPADLSHSALVYGHPGEFIKPDHPVAGVSWDDAVAYCRFRGKRLPGEAEWEHAARGGDGRRYVWGNEPPDPRRHGVFGGRRATEAVGRYPEGRGPFGHEDLAGNVWEWVADEYDPYAYRRPGADTGRPGSCAEIIEAQNELRRRGQQGFTGKNPIPVECEHVLRGGAYNYGAPGLRAANRVHHPARFRIPVAGFRCAKSEQ